MSHVVSSPVVVQKIDCLKKAVEKIHGLTWCEGQKTHAWYGSWQDDYAKKDAAYKLGIDPKDYGKCEHAIRVKGSTYEIGVVKRNDGTGYALVWDFWGPGKKINTVIGAGGEKLLVEYQKEYLKQFATEQGFSFSMEQTSEDVTIEMEQLSML